MSPDPYFSRPEVSNSDLSKLKKELYGIDTEEPIEAYRFGTLLDALITEPYKVNEFNLTVQGVDLPYTIEQFEQAKAMRKAFGADSLCTALFLKSKFQKVDTAYLNFEYEGVEFALNARCKWDGWVDNFGWDLKSTTAKTQKQFEDACEFFDYDRQRHFYMRIGKSKIDWLIGISKENFKVFKLPIKINDPFFNQGQEKTNLLAFQYWKLYAT